MTIQPTFCEHCARKLTLADEVVEAMRIGDVKRDDGTTARMDIGAFIFRADHYPGDSEDWREIRRGPLDGIRPTAT